ncbi:MAG TPA: MerR family transcriptional regulator [Pyrinomonadaceae bacterium]|jgi:DNA-binding transcriptional MerR regulator|nr:MerR family transcriptional regulator [Pyrinomonadaceae bacterium]
MRERLESVRHKKFIGVAELAEQAAEILSEGGPVQERGTVTEVPDERTVRYYLTEGLISPAEEKQGTASVFGYIHLLQLLVVKKLQSERLPIRMIRELVSSGSERKLERLLGSEQDRRATKAGDKNDALRYLETLLTKAHSAPPSPPRASGPLPTRASPPASPSVGQSEQAKWERVEIEPGLELHIRGNYGMPQESRGVRRLVQSILRTIEAYGGRPGKRGG